MSEREVLQLLKVARKTERRLKKSTLFRKQRMKSAAEPTAAASPMVAPRIPPLRPLPAGTSSRQHPGPPRSGRNGPAPGSQPPPLTLRARQAPMSGAPEPRPPPANGPPPLPGAHTEPEPAGALLRNLPRLPFRLGTPARVSTPNTPTVPQSAPHADPSPPGGHHPSRPTAGPPPPGRQAGGAVPPPLPGQERRAGPPPLPGQLRPNDKPAPDFSNLPPAIAESLAKLSGRESATGRGRTPQTPAASETTDTPGKPTGT
jgi:hypothetical protein